MLKNEKRGDPFAGIASLLYFYSKSPVFTQNRTAGKLKLFSDEKAHFLLSSLSLFPFSFFLFPFLLLLLFPFFPLLLSSSLSALFSLPLCPYLFFLPSLPPRYQHFIPPVRHTLLLLWLFYRLSTRARTLFNYKRL